jgi:hypothetical protein
LPVSITTVPPVAELAPIAPFSFKRPQQTRRTLEALPRSLKFTDSLLYVFCGGARRPDDEAAVSEAREIVRAWSHPLMTLEGTCQPRAHQT